MRLLTVLLSAVWTAHALPAKPIIERGPPQALPERATRAEKLYQPVMDFDKDSCYNTPYIGRDGRVASGLTTYSTQLTSSCRDKSDLENNNVYSRSRCNNGWCAYMYEYYFEKDVANPGIHDVIGHRHDFESVVVFVHDNSTTRRPAYVATSSHGNYKTLPAREVHMHGMSAKIVYHKDGGFTHAMRFAVPSDEAIENHTGHWFKGALIGWNGWLNIGLRKWATTLEAPRGATPKLSDPKFGRQLWKAMHGGSTLSKIKNFNPFAENRTTSEMYDGLPWLNKDLEDEEKPEAETGSEETGSES